MRTGLRDRGAAPYHGDEFSFGGVARTGPRYFLDPETRRDGRGLGAVPDAVPDAVP